MEKSAYLMMIKKLLIKNEKEERGSSLAYAITVHKNRECMSCITVVIVSFTNNYVMLQKSAAYTNYDQWQIALTHNKYGMAIAKAVATHKMAGRAVCFLLIS